jgi:hypothetical protein
MKITSLLLAVPLVLGAGFASAETTTTTEKTVNSPVGSTDSSVTTERSSSWDGKTVEKRKSTTENPDGSVTTERSKTVEKHD